MKKSLRIMGKRIDLDASSVLWDKPFSAATFAEHWDVRGGEWAVEGDALVGKGRQPGVFVFSQQRFPGNVLMEFYGQTVLPSTHDLDFMWNTEWDEKTQTRKTGYVVGIQGWWHGKLGVERPDSTFGGMVPCPWFRPGVEYFIQAGSIEGHCFVFVNGSLMFEAIDPTPVDSQRYNRVGFEVFQSMIRVRALTLRQIAWTTEQSAYPEESF